MSFLIRSLASRAVAAPVAARTFATKTPPSVFGATGKLATKLFDESRSNKSLVQVRSDLKKFREVYEQSFALRSVFLNPLVSQPERDQALNDVFKTAGIQSKEAQSFILAAAATKNLNRIKQIVTDFDKLVTFELKEVPVTVTSADALTPQQVKRLEAALKKKVGSDQTLILTANVDPTILGGLIVVMEQQMLDLSVANQIRKLDVAVRS